MKSGSRRWLRPTTEAGERGVHPESMREAVKQERLPALYAFGKLLIKEADIEAHEDRTQPNGVKRVGRSPRRIEKHLIRTLIFQARRGILSER